MVFYEYVLMLNLVYVSTQQHISEIAGNILALLMKSFTRIEISLLEILVRSTRCDMRQAATCCQ